MPFSQAPSNGLRRHRVTLGKTDPSEGSTYAWMTANEAVGCSCAFLTMWRSSRQLIRQGRPEPRLRVNDLSQIH
ncbi:hypothetical protein TNCV_85431 [Trichonephila clavipes]|nr:hypothetical protein TNCV_85431 [Trichonephila clavipes]